MTRTDFKRAAPTREQVQAMVDAGGLDRLSRARRCFDCREEVSSTEAAEEAGWTLFRPGLFFCRRCWPKKQLELFKLRRLVARQMREAARWLEDLARDEVNEDTAKWIHYSWELGTKLSEERTRLSSSAGDDVRS